METVNVPWKMRRGIPMMDFFMGDDELDELLDFVPKPKDIFLITYPKCGTTWTQYIIWGIVNKGADPPEMNEFMFKIFPFLDVVGSKFLYTKEDPRLFKLHLPPQFFTISPEAKYIFVLRNPWDCSVSYYFHTKEMSLEDTSFDDYFKMFIEGNVPYGDYFEYVNEVLKYKDNKNVLMLHYEDMKKNHRENVLKIAKFLGEEYYSALDEETVDNIVKHTDFKFMKEKIIVQRPMKQNKISRADFIARFSKMGMDSPFKGEMKPFDFFRKGQIGDHKNFLDDDQRNQLYEQMKEKIIDKELVEYWSQFMK